MLLTKEKGFYKNFFSLWIVLVLNNVIILGVNLADNIMLGNFTEEALAGATACNQLQFIFQQLILGIGNACSLTAGNRNSRGNAGTYGRAYTGTYGRAYAGTHRRTYRRTHRRNCEKYRNQTIFCWRYDDSML